MNTDHRAILRATADAVLRDAGPHLDTLDADELWRALRKRNAEAAAWFVREALGEMDDAHVLSTLGLSQSSQADCGRLIDNVLTDYALSYLRNRRSEWPQPDLGECDEHVAADNRERVRAVMEARR